MIDYQFLTKQVKAKGFKMLDVAEKLGVQYQTLNKNLKNGSFDTLYKIAEVIGVNFVELLPPPAGFRHDYTPSGAWLGIVPIGGNATPLYIKDASGELVKVGTLDK